MSKETYPNYAANYIANEVWQDSAQATLVYQHLAGLGHDVTNHYSDMLYTILDGVGVMHTPHVQMVLRPKSLVAIEQGTRHQIRGNLTYFMETEPGIHPELIMYGDQKLGPAERIMIRGIQRAARKQKRMEQRIAIMNEIMEKYVGPIENLLAIQQLANTNELL